MRAARGPTDRPPYRRISEPSCPQLGLGMAPIEAFGTNNPLGYFLSDISPSQFGRLGHLLPPRPDARRLFLYFFFWGGGNFIHRQALE